MVKLKNLTNSDISIDDSGFTVSPTEYYEISGENAKESDELLGKIISGAIAIVKSESPEILLDSTDAVKFVLTGTLDISKTSASGEMIIVNENNGHLPNNRVINWTIDKYLEHDGEYYEKMILPVNTIATLNMFSGGSFNVPTYLTLEWFQWDHVLNKHIRKNPDIRIEEVYIGKIKVAVAGGETDIPIKMNNGSTGDIKNFESDFYYEIQTSSGNKFCAKVIKVDYNNAIITLDTPVPAEGCSVDGKITLVDRALVQKGNQISSSSHTWITPPRLQGDGISYLKITITNEHKSEPGVVTAVLNGWIENGIIGE
jgi:hypothetical protein